jgi:hypothetical protein
MSSDPFSKPVKPSGVQDGHRVTVWIVAGAVVVLLIAVTLIAVGLGGAEGGPGSRPGNQSPEPLAESPSPAPSDGPGSSPSPSIDPGFGAPVAETVPKDRMADFGDGVTARIRAITAVTAVGTLPGEVSGPAVQVDLEISNGTSAEISLAVVTVNAFYGADRTPASPYSQPGDEAFPTTLAPGATASARYLFSVPTEAQSSVVITVSTSAGGPIVVFA